ncbi:PH domain-containing protein [Paludifilum halophilum]|uniref:YdbS-like PH domain-containing protein n=1 Tax=Paludifilum halophilum TaxID=1642702 RepID=A0A235B829_9BACL|nr:PH domain-containing protein [Paludifilum halophilum]OYD08411.1 hypothetical protein CHM34_06135 [Paludifilum halophilum]
MNKPRRLHPSTILVTIIKNIKELLYPLLVSFGISLFSEDMGQKLIWVLTGSSAVLIWIIANSFLRWYRQVYYLENDEFRIEKGAWLKRKIYIPLERIQSVDDVERIWHRLFGVVQLQIETASSESEPEAVLAAVTKRDAAKLKRALFRRPRAGKQSPSAGEGEKLSIENQPDRPRLRLSHRRLLIAGLTSGRIGVMLAVLGPLFSIVIDLIDLDTAFFESIFRSAAPFFSLGGVIVLVLIGALGAWLLSIGSTVILEAGFTVRHDGNYLFIERGLLERRRTSLPLKKIQAVHLVESVLRQPFGFVTIQVESAGYGGESDQRVVCFPLLKRSEIDTFLADFLPEFAPASRMGIRPLPSRVRKRMIGYSLPITAGLAGTAWYFSPSWGGYAFFLPLLDALYGYWRFKSGGWQVEKGVAVFRSRLINRRTVFLPRRAIQSRTLSQNPLTRRAGLAVFQARLASGNQYESKLLERTDAVTMIRETDPEPNRTSA